MPGTDRPAPTASRTFRALDHLAVGCLMVGAGGAVTYANPTALAQLAAPADRVVGMPVWGCFPAAVRPAVEGCCRTALATATPQRLDCAVGDGRHVEMEAIPDGDGLVVYFSDAGDRRHLERLARRDALILAATGEGYAATPLVEDGRVVGTVVAFDDTSERVAAEETRGRAERYRRRADELAAAERALHELQAAMQPPALELDDPELGVHYVPAHGAAAGGDLYDWQLLPDGSLHVAVVDVIGKGVPAAKDAIAVTHALRLLVLAEVALADVVRQADGLLGRAFPELVATAVVCRYHPGSGRLRVAGGGHPPPLVVAADGAADYLDSGGRAVGWPLAGSDGVVETTVEPGGTLVLYTDGLVEAQRDIVHGMVALQRAAGRLSGLPAQRLAEALVVDALATAERRDDTLCLVLRRTARAA